MALGGGHAVDTDLVTQKPAPETRVITWIDVTPARLILKRERSIA